MEISTSINGKSSINRGAFHYHFGLQYHLGYECLGKLKSDPHVTAGMAGLVPSHWHIRGWAMLSNVKWVVIWVVMSSIPPMHPWQGLYALGRLSCFQTLWGNFEVSKFGVWLIFQCVLMCFVVVSISLFMSARWIKMLQLLKGGHTIWPSVPLLSFTSHVTCDLHENEVRVWILLWDHFEYDYIWHHIVWYTLIWYTSIVNHFLGGIVRVAAVGVPYACQNCEADLCNATQQAAPGTLM